MMSQSGERSDVLGRQLPSISRKISKEETTPFKHRRSTNTERTASKYESTSKDAIRLPHLMGKKDWQRNKNERQKASLAGNTHSSTIQN